MNYKYTYWEEETEEQKRERLLHLPFLGPIIYLRDNKVNYTTEEEVQLKEVLPFSIGQTITSHDKEYTIFRVDWCLDHQRLYVTCALNLYK